GVYEESEILDRILNRYLAPVALILTVFFGYLYYKWRAERKFSQQQILNYQQRTQLALEGADLGLWDWDVPSGNVFFNERWCNMLGYQADEIASHLSSWETLVHPDDWAVIKPVLNGHLEGKIPRYESEHRLRHKNGQWIWVLVRGKVMERGIRGEPIRFVGTDLDITERKNNQEFLQTLLAEQQAMLDNHLIGFAKIRDSIFIWANPTFEKMLGYDKDELIGKPTNKHFISEEEYQAFSKDCYPALNCNSSYRAQVRQVRKDGSQIWVDLSCTIMDQEKNELIGVIIDVTERKLAEDAKLDALNHINKIASQVPGVVYQYCLRPDGSACFPYASEGIQEIYRVNPEQVREDASKVLAIFHPEDYEGIQASILSSAKNLTRWQYEYRVKFDDGTIRWLFGNALPNKQEDGSVLWHGFITDITERRKIEALLHESEVRNALILNCAELGTWDWQIKTGQVIYNEHWARMRGYRLDEIEQHVSEWEKRIHPDDLAKVKSTVAEHFKYHTGFFHAEYRVCTKSGQWIWILDRGAVIEYDADGNPLRMAGTEMDITGRKQAEKDLLTSRERLYFALQGANDGMWDWNFVTNEVYYSPRWKSMLGYAEHELADRLETWSELVDPTERKGVLQNVKDYIDGVSPNFEVEFRMLHKDGHWVDILSRAKLAVDAEGRQLTPRRLIGTHVDISDRKNQEQQRLVQEMAHRNTLVREVHHRIKNNIQGITGILRQFAETHPETLAPINHAISQMQSIAVIYGLQGQDSISRVLISDLLIAIARGIELLWKIPVPVDILPAWPIYIIAENEAVPLALVLNELILNAVKHAGHPKRVNVILRTGSSHEMIHISILNTGQLPPDFNFDNRRQINTGLNLVASLLPRAGSRLSFEQQGPTVVTLLEFQSPVIKLEYQS
ncbi:MAG: PAS domain-containing protein, partial [Methylobacter sp.]